MVKKNNNLPKVKDLLKKVVLSEHDIQSRIKEVGQQITKDYADKENDGIVVISILKGAAIFMTDLVRAIDLNLEIDFMSVSSYGNSTKTKGRAIIEKDISTDILGKHVILAEDVIDSGITMDFVIKHLSNRGAASITVCAFLHKHIEQRDIDVKYQCFDCPKEFIVGYGLDYLQYYRNVPYIFALKEEFLNE